ncbi:MAG TPA: 7TM-DISM domain-containing protein [Cyclobacteriaceae bacterium]|nr:7TM-DISM domain-containing protein [Cyclobacteriaceae bacterium]
MSKIFTFFIFVSFSFSSFGQVFEEVVRGKLDLRNWNPDTQPVISLDGEWIFQWEQLLTWNELANGSKTYADFSTPWSEQLINGNKLPNNGFATYGMEIILPIGTEEISLQVPAFFNSYLLWINDVLICSNGTVGLNKTEEVPEWKPQSVNVKLQSNTVHVVLQISNFQDTRGGAAQIIKISNATKLIQISVRDNITGSIVFLIFIVVGVVSILVYYISRQKNILFYSLVAITFSIRFLFSDMYLHYEIIPFEIPWGIAVRIEYATIPLIVIWSVLFLAGQYPNEFKKPVRSFFLLASGLFFMLTVFIGFQFISQLLLFMQVTSLAFLVYSIFAIISALLYERVGAWLSALGLAIFVLVGFYNIAIIVSGGELNRIIIYVGYTIALLLNALSLFYRTEERIAKEARNKLSYSDFYLDTDK